MKFICDLHLHSHYSRATSSSMNIEEMSKWAKKKGLDVLGTGDFTHPLWQKEIREKLSPSSDGIFEFDGMKFILSAEISLIYSQAGRVRKIHNVLLAPSFEIVDSVRSFLKTKGRLDYDGRPIFGMSCIELMENLPEEVVVIPAHAFTPWFSIFGSMSGFDSVEECFGEYSKRIFALETGLSSTPAMNWRVSSLDKYALVSNSDSHSPWPWRIGREANIFELSKLSFDNMINAIKNKNPKEFLYTIEFHPEEGKYHFTGHRACKVCMHPRDAVKIKDVCPVCRRKMTVGVLERVEALADRPEGFVPKCAIPFKKLIPLSEIIASVYGVSGVFSKKVWAIWNKLVDVFGTEFNVLLDAPFFELKDVVPEQLARAVILAREQKVEVVPGYDGVYGKPVFPETMKEESQSNLGKFL